MAATFAQVEVQAHHEQRRVCDSRAKYRDGRRPRAVKVYTVNLESRYLLVQGVPAIGVMKELIEQFALYGVIEEYNALDEYPAEEFTEVYLIKFQRLQSARVAKRKLDERSFFGGLLHVCYAPEFESVQETREKLQDRRKFVARATSNKGLHQNTGTSDTVVKGYKAEQNQGAATNSRRIFESGLCEPGYSLGQVSNCNLHLQQTEPVKPCFTVPSAKPPVYSQNSFPALTDTRREASPENAHQNDPASHIAERLQKYRTNAPVKGVPIATGVSCLRFTPRTTQLQERQRKREHNNALGLCGSSSDNGDFVIGPKLPEIPKLDMDDPSLNRSADFIRDRLKEVSGTSKQTTLESPAEDKQTVPPKKPRRRI
ncbi:RNA-binding protein 48 [Pelodytes ibericus]